MFEIELLICIKMDLALNNQQWLICHKTKPNQMLPFHTIGGFEFIVFLLQDWLPLESSVSPTTSKNISLKLLNHQKIL